MGRISSPARLVLVSFFFLASEALAATTWYVNGVNGSDNNDCKSPPTACKTIGHAVSLAASGDSISVAAATYTENLTISLSLKLIGGGATTTIIDGGAVNTVLTISSATASVFLSQFTIRNGKAPTFFAGGGISNSGNLTISNCTVSGNSASVGGGGGIDNGGTLTIKNSTISGNSVVSALVPHGGGISNGGSMTVSNSSVTGNTLTGTLQEAFGGGVVNSGTLTINNSTLSGNTVSIAISACDSANGGGISNSGTLTINNSTLSGNTAVSTEGDFCGSPSNGGGLYISSGTTIIKNSTLSGNSAGGRYGGSGGGISGPATLQNSIVANSPAGGNCAGTLTSSGYNLSSDGSCNFTNTGDLNDTDPKLGPLQNNGGPTQTQALLAGSPAIDAGNPNGCTDSKGHLLKTDQRGKPRPDKEDTGGCDMGAYESQHD